MDFCMRLAKQLMVREVENRRVGNIVVSPLSLNALLNMVVVGLKGPTLEHVLGFWGSTNTNEICSKSSQMMAIVADCGSSQKAEDGPILAMVNGAWVDQKYPLKDPYKEMLKTIYHYERDGLQDLLKKLIANPSEYFNNLPHRELGKFWIPKFKFSYGFDVAEAMECMGMKFSFSKNPEDLSQMLHVPKGVPFFDPAIIQKAAIEIDEKGTEAAAATEVEFLCGSSMYKSEKLDFVADHPFVFMIREYASGFVFFTGAVIDPSKSN
ncbi:hypothetical protein Acr_05g0005370 [Actinidia rufa]|uniref:Serpin domain-containing protein n=1 Tax=Actinidia rufa TaxID=165716 RepID=A0A7J0EKA9_9ERIC|nr:hypothetical protein Acr_05g0005370 [Actinidia rufa]